MSLRIALIGLGEVGAILADDLSAHTLTAWDAKFGDPAAPPLRNARARNIAVAEGAFEAAIEADLVISAVTPGQAQNVAEECAGALREGALYLDLNSASPGAKIAAARAVDGYGAHYIEAAVMSPVSPKRIATPILLGGPHARTAAPLLQNLGFAGVSVFSDEYGVAAAAKLCRSVMVKGIEALLFESLVSARSYGVEQAVLSSLSDLFPHPDWQKHAHYMISRALEHGERRAEEMFEAARTVSEAGLAPLMSTAAAERQAKAAQHSAALQANDLQALLDAILRASERNAS